MSQYFELFGPHLASKFEESANKSQQKSCWKISGKVSKNSKFYAELKQFKNLQISLPRKIINKNVKEICCFHIYTHDHKIGWV